MATNCAGFVSAVILPGMNAVSPSRANVPASVGIVGAGQLARMMIGAAIPLDIHVVLLAERADDSAAQICPDVLVGSPDDPALLRELAERVEVVTFDHELVDPVLVAALEEAGVAVQPSAATMALAQNKRRQRAELAELGVPAPAFWNVDVVDDLLGFGEEQGWPVVAKASRGGYDGRGVWTLDDADAARRLWEGTRAAEVELLVETWLPLEKELAVLLARRPNGETAVYPTVETVQRGGICRELRVPAAVAPDVAAAAQHHAVTIAEAIDAVGILAVEFFVADGRLLVNELAPRPHNSGHWTIEGAITSQFEQHLRAVLDWPLGSTALTGDAVATVNVLGPADGSGPWERIGAALAVRGVHLHSYGKAARPGRKLGHVTCVADTLEGAVNTARDAGFRLMGEPYAHEEST